MGLSPAYFWGLAWYDWILEIYRYHYLRQKEENELEIQKIFFGKLYATIGNFAGKVLPKNAHLSEKDFFKFSDDTEADEVDILELMERPELKYRFKKDG